jgi:mercuric ion transport protein
MPGDRNTRLLGAGAIGAAFAASACCVGPIVLALLGLGGGALLLKFEPYRPYFLGATALALGGAFFLTYRRPSPESCEPGAACSNPSTRRRQKIALWIVAAIVLLIAAFPYYGTYLF